MMKGNRVYFIVNNKQICITVASAHSTSAWVGRSWLVSPLVKIVSWLISLTEVIEPFITSAVSELVLCNGWKGDDLCGWQVYSLISMVLSEELSSLFTSVNITKPTLKPSRTGMCKSKKIISKGLLLATTLSTVSCPFIACSIWMLGLNWLMRMSSTNRFYT